MSEQSIHISRRRILAGLAVFGGASAAAGAGTAAYFTDTETSSNNQVTAGTLALQFGDTGTFDFSTTLAPTKSTSATVTLESAGTNAGSLDIDVDYSENDASGAPTPDMSAQQLAERLEVTTLEYGGTNLTGQIDTTNDPLTLHDLATNLHDGSESTQNDLIDLADPGASGTDFTVELRLQDVGDDYQGDGVDVTVTFHLNQTDGQ